MPRYNPAINGRHGYGFEFEVTQEEVAQRLGITKARVGQIERRALQKLRKAIEERARELGLESEAAE